MSLRVEFFFAPGCNRYKLIDDALQEIAREVCASEVIWRDVNVIDEIDYAIELGVVTLPSLAINGELCKVRSFGALEFRKELERRLLDRLI
ncbi:glutaredoxin [Burkholderia sp. BCC1972]|uniref:glutaredoxin n=1 Tax=Burkholderia sp. BCC1972 TaxID=2817438 RepID=UPI002ABE0DBF|nr:glutaredoxin [Burkholderia sp. BCC1972]